MIKKYPINDASMIILDYVLKMDQKKPPVIEGAKTVAVNGRVL